jgi:hypothetical protein
MTRGDDVAPSLSPTETKWGQPAPPLMWTSNTSDTSKPTHNQISGPITRALARQLNNQVSSFLASYPSYLDNGNMCSILLLRNDGHERNGVAFAPATFGFQNNSSLWQPPDHIWIWIQVCKYFLESSWSLLLYASNLRSISCRSRPQSLFWCRDLFPPTVLWQFWPIGPCIMLSPIRTCPRVGAWPSLPEVVLPHL